MRVKTQAAENSHAELSLLLDGALDEGHAEWVQNELASNVELAGEWEDLCHVVKLVGALPDEPLPDGFCEGVRNRIRRKTAGRYFSRAHFDRFPLVAAACVLIQWIALGVIISDYHTAMPQSISHGSAAAGSLYPVINARLSGMGVTVAGETERCHGGIELWIPDAGVERVNDALGADLTVELARGFTRPGSGMARACVVHQSMGSASLEPG